MTENVSAIAVVISSLVGATGLFGSIYALLKIRPEAGQITVNAAQGAVIVQTGVIENLNKELARVSAEMLTERSEKEKLQEELDKERKELDRYKQRTRDLEEEIVKLRERINDLEKGKQDKT